MENWNGLSASEERRGLNVTLQMGVGQVEVELTCPKEDGEYGVLWEVAYWRDSKKWKVRRLQWDLTFSQVVWLLGLLNCSSHTKDIHEIGDITINLISLGREGKGYIA
eukprot:1156142-Pelagomonas_calceolata.AAC.14